MNPQMAWPKKKKKPTQDIPTNSKSILYLSLMRILVKFRVLINDSEQQKIGQEMSSLAEVFVL